MFSKENSPLVFPLLLPLWKKQQFGQGFLRCATNLVAIEEEDWPPILSLGTQGHGIEDSLHQWKKGGTAEPLISSTGAPPAFSSPL